MNSVYQTSINVKRSEVHSYNYDWNRVPDTLKRPHVPESHRVLYMNWIDRADQTDTGIIEIKLRHQIFSHETVAKALRLFHKLNLAHLHKRGIGRGYGSTYQIRWSKAYKSIGERQRAKNHQKPPVAISVNYTKGRRAFNILKSGIKMVLNLKKEKRSLCKHKMNYIHPSLRRKSRNSFKNPQNPQLMRKNSRPFRWAMASIRPPVKSTFIAKHDQDAAIQAFGITISKAIEKYKFTPGQRWGQFTKCIIQLIENTDELELWAAQNDFQLFVMEEEELQNRKLTEKERCALILPDFCRWAGYVVKEALSISSSHRRSVQDYLAVMSPRGGSVISSSHRRSVQDYLAAMLRKGETVGVGQGS